MPAQRSVTETRKYETYWGTCPNCFRERYIVHGVMKEHRMWIRLNIPTPTTVEELYVSQYGTMVRCSGSGKNPL